MAKCVNCGVNEVMEDVIGVGSVSKTERALTNGSILTSFYGIICTRQRQ
jgi:hypothetical protein